MTEEIDEEIQEKQNYLRQNIIDKGYDAGIFVEFLIGKKGEEGSDVANWSLPDLKNVVQEFIQLNNGQGQEENNNINNNIEKNDNNNKNKQIENIQQNKIEECNYGIINTINMPCLKVNNNEISNCNNIKITVGNFEKVEGNFFSKSYVSYLVTTMPFNWNVRRRFSDFEWLRQTLINNYNYCLIPSVPKKPKNLNKLMNEKYDKEFLSKRSRNFEKFLNYIIIDPILKNTQIIYDFLKLDNDDEFQKIKKAYDKLKQTGFNINKVNSIDGNAIIEINEEKENYFSDIKESSNQNENILKKINSTIKSLKDDLINASEKSREIAENFNLIKENSIKYKENDDLIISYGEMSSMFDNFSKYLSNQKEVIFINLREYFKYIKNNYRSMKDFISKTENLKNIFYKSFKNLKTKKESLFEKKEIYKMDFDPKEKIDKNIIINNKNLTLEKMLYKETSQVNNQKIIYGFYLNRIIQEHNRMKIINSEYHYNICLKILEIMTNNSTDFITSLADCTAELAKNEKIEENKENIEENINNNNNNENS